MKKISLLFSALSLAATALGQGKWDHQWILGIAGSTTGSNLILMDFRGGAPAISNITGPKDFEMSGSNTSMCDKDGELMFYSSGCEIVSASGEVMPNGDSITPGFVQKAYCANGGSHPFRQGVLALPAPASDSLYYVFSIDLELAISQPGVLAVAPLHHYYQLVDMSKNGGLGHVELKNQVAIADTLARAGIQACRHANGRDWWVVVPETQSNCYYSLLVSPEGVHPPEKRCAGHVWNWNDSGTQAVFSPNGKWYARFNGFNGLSLFRFDSATGELLSPQQVFFPDDTIRYVIGAAISPNSRFLYVCTGLKVIQFDLLSDDISGSRVKVAQWDGHYDPFPTLFYLAALAPDGKIYISHFSSTLSLHVINRPNCPGLSCEVSQHSVALPTHNTASIPNMPHYRGNDLDCDSTLLGARRPARAGRALAWPSPAGHSVTVEIGNDARGGWQVTDTAGRQRLAGDWEGQRTEVGVASLPPGMYFIEVREHGGRRHVGKFAVQR